MISRSELPAMKTQSSIFFIFIFKCSIYAAMPSFINRGRAACAKEKKKQTCPGVVSQEGKSAQWAGTGRVTQTLDKCPTLP